MTVLARFTLFLSSYAPLAGVFALLGSFGGGWSTWVCAALAVSGPVLLAAVFFEAKRLAPQSLLVKSTQVRDGDALAYLVTYLVPFVAITASTLREQLALGLFVLLIAVIYVQSELFYVNPILAAVGYRVFQVTTSTDKATVVLLSRRHFLPSNTTLDARRLGEYVYWEKGRN